MKTSSNVSSTTAKHCHIVAVSNSCRAKSGTAAPWIVSKTTFYLRC